MRKCLGNLEKEQCAEDDDGNPNNARASLKAVSPLTGNTKPAKHSNNAKN
jgi:hypothetical protein